MRSSLSPASIVIAACALGCSGADTNALFEGRDGSGSSGSAGAGGSAGTGAAADSGGAAGSSASGGAGGVAPDAPVAGDSSGSGGAGATGGSGGSPDGGTGGSGGSRRDGGSIDTTQIKCGNLTCSIPLGACCIDRRSRLPSYACATNGTCPASMFNPIALKCRSKANCVTDLVDGVCCLSSTGGQESSQCQTACYPGDVVLCDPGDAAVTGCEAFQQCSYDTLGQWGMPTGFAMCW